MANTRPNPTPMQCNEVLFEHNSKTQTHTIRFLMACEAKDMETLTQYIHQIGCEIESLYKEGAYFNTITVRNSPLRSSYCALDSFPNKEKEIDPKKSDSLFNIAMFTIMAWLLRFNPFDHIAKHGSGPYQAKPYSDTKYFLYIIDIIRTRPPKRIIHDLSTAKEPLIDALRKLYLNPARDLAATEAKTLNWSENPFIQAFQDKLAQSLRKFPLTQPDKRHQAAKNAFDEVYKTFCPNGVSLEVPAHSTPNTVAHITARLQPTLENKSPRPASHDIPSPATPGRAIPQDLQPNFKAGFKSSLPELPNLLAAYEEIEDHHLKAVVKKPAVWKCPDSEQTLLDRYESEGIEQAANTEETEDTTEELYRKIMGKK